MSLAAKRRRNMKIKNKIKYHYISTNVYIYASVSESKPTFATLLVDFWIYGSGLSQWLIDSGNPLTGVTLEYCVNLQPPTNRIFIQVHGFIHLLSLSLWSSTKVQVVSGGCIHDTPLQNKSLLFFFPLIRSHAADA